MTFFVISCGLSTSNKYYDDDDDDDNERHLAASIKTQETYLG